MGLFDDDGWYERPSLAFGTSADITATARIFDDVAAAMLDARSSAVDFADTSGDMWRGHSADFVREQMTEVPELLRRFHVANDDVADALTMFAPSFESYCDTHRQLSTRGRSTHHEMLSVKSQRDRAIDRLRADDVMNVDVIGAIGGLVTGYEDDPEVRALTDRLRQLSNEFDVARSQFQGNDDEFEAAVERAADAISNADRALYNNGWDKFWSQTAAPILEVVKVVLEIVSIVVMLAVIFGSGGTLAPLVLAVMLLAVNAAQVAGTAAAGREVTKEMWFDLAMSAVAVATAGFAHYATNLRAASAANKLEADKLLKAKTSFHNATKASARLQNADSLARAADRADDVARGFEIIEGSGNIAQGGAKIDEGLRTGDGWKIAGGALGVVGGAYDVSGHGFGEVGNVVGDGAKIGGGAMGAIDGVGNIAEGIPETPGSESPKDWPGLDGLSAR